MQSEAFVDRTVVAQQQHAVLSGLGEDMPSLLTCDAAVAYALSHNLEWYARKQQRYLEQWQWGFLALDAAPKVQMRYGTSRRSKRHASVSETVATGAIGTTYTSSGLLTEGSGSLQATWDALDVALTHIRWKQQGAKMLSMAYHDRRLRQNLALEVKEAYWNAIAAQWAHHHAQTLLEEISTSQTGVQQHRANKLISKGEALEHEERLLVVRTMLHRYAERYQKSLTELTRLMGVPYVRQVTLPTLQLPQLTFRVINPQLLESWALSHRAELFLSDLESYDEYRRMRGELLQQFPRLSTSVNFSSSTNPFLLYRHWHTVGLDVAWQLMQLAKISSHTPRLADQKEYRRRHGLALAAGIISQVRLAHIALLHRIQHYHLNYRLSDIKQQQLDVAQKQHRVGVLRPLALLHQKVENFSANADAIFAYADLEIAAARVQNTIGAPVTSTALINRLVRNNLRGVVLPEEKIVVPPIVPKAVVPPLPKKEKRPTIVAPQKPLPPTRRSTRFQRWQKLRRVCQATAPEDKLLATLVPHWHAEAFGGCLLLPPQPASPQSDTTTYKRQQKLHRVCQATAPEDKLLATLVPHWHAETFGGCLWLPQTQKKIAKKHCCTTKIGIVEDVALAKLQAYRRAYFAKLPSSAWEEVPLAPEKKEQHVSHSMDHLLDQWVRRPSDS